MLDTEKFDHIPQEGGRRRRPGIIRMIKNKIIIVISSETSKTAITKNTSLLTSRYQTAKSEQRAGSRMIRTGA